MKTIIYVLDSLRADHLPFYGYKRQTAPNLDQLAREAVTFDNCHSPSTWTKPVAASLLTGTYPPVHGTETRVDRLGKGSFTLAHLFSQFGAATAGISAMGNVSSAFGYSNGFDRFYDLYKDERLFSRRRTSQAGEEKLPHDPSTTIAMPLAEDLNEVAIPWLTEHRLSDFFLFIWSIDPHAPYDPPPGFGKFVNPDYTGRIDGTRTSIRSAKSDTDIERLIDLYDSEIFYNDHCIGQLISSLQKMGIYDDVLLIVLGDHGESFGEHGLFSHGHLPYDVVTHVPLIMKFPKGLYGGSKVPALVSLVDVMPTIVDAYDLELGSTSVQGKSLLPLVKSETNSVWKYVYSVTGTLDKGPRFYSVRDDNWKYIHVENSQGSRSLFQKFLSQKDHWKTLKDVIRHPAWFFRRYGKSERPMLFDLQNDPAEDLDLLSSHPELAEKFRAELLRWLEECQGLKVDRNKDALLLDEDQVMQEHLKALGYIE